MEGSEESGEEEGAGEWNRESVRLASFARWSRLPVIAVDKLARAGLYYTGRGDTVRCFHCHTRISRWRFGDEAARRHRDAAPNCDFIHGASDAGNVPLRLEAGADRASAPTTTTTTTTPTAMEEGDEQWRSRLRTFRHWPKETTVAAESLARAGFVFSGRGDTTECVSCSGRLQQWHRGDDPLREHLAHFPLCALAQRLSTSVPTVPDQARAQVTDGTEAVSRVSTGSGAEGREVGSGTATKVAEELGRLGIFSSLPKHAHLATLGSRLASFQGWPATATQRPLQLASAGFFYTGVADKVKCFHCEGGLHNWLPNDSVYREHAKWFPHCDYIRLIKGQDYVADAADVDESVAGGRRRRAATVQSRARIDFAALDENGVNSQSEVIKTAREMGFSEADICGAVVANNWRSFQSPDELVDAITSGRLPQSVEEVVEEESESSEMETSRGSMDIEEEVSYLREQRRCKICMDAEVCVVLVPCGHLCCCATCVSALSDCPICRKPLLGRLKAYFA